VWGIGAEGVTQGGVWWGLCQGIVRAYTPDVSVVESCAGVVSPGGLA